MNNNAPRMMPDVNEASFMTSPLRLAIALLMLTIIAVMVFTWEETPVAAYFSPQNMAPFFENVRDSVWAVPAVIGVFVIGNLVCFPLTILILTTAIAFPPSESFVLALAGSMISACIGYGAGRLAGFKSLAFFAGRNAEKISKYAKEGGVLGVAFLRLMPLAPLGVVDLGLGMAKIPFAVYLVGTILGLVPGILILCFLGNSLGELWQKHSLQMIIYVAIGLVGWVGIIFLSHFLIKRAHEKAETAGK